MKVAIEAIQKVKEDLRDQLKDVDQLIKFLNSNNREELSELGVEDRIETIIQV